MPLKLNIEDPDFEADFTALLNQKRDEDKNVDTVAADILNDVRKRGDAALLDYTRKFDRLDIADATALRITKAEIEKAIGECDRETLSALNIAAGRIERYHKQQLPDDHFYEDADGVKLGYRWTAIENVGLYVPGGRATYPSSVLMNAIPAKVAGASRVVMVVPTPDGAINPMVLAAADLCGVDEIYRIGGAQAVGALAFGTETITPVAFETVSDSFMQDNARPARPKNHIHFPRRCGHRVKVDHCLTIGFIDCGLPGRLLEIKIISGATACPV